MRDEEGQVFVKVQSGFKVFHEITQGMSNIFPCNVLRGWRFKLELVMMDLIFLGVKQCDAIFKVRITRVFSVRKSGRVQQLYILLTALESYVGFSITSGGT